MSAAAINQGTHDAANTLFVDAFNEIFSKADKGALERYTQIIPADAETVELDAQVDLGVVREWIGPKEFGTGRAYKLAVAFRKWEKSLKLPRSKVKYDKSGTLASRFKQWMSEQVGFWDKVMTDTLVSASGAGPTGYDGVALLSTAHPHGPDGGTQSNKGTSALTFSTYETAKVAMGSLAKENGEPLRISPKFLMVGPKLERIAKEITQSKERVIAVDNAGVETGTRVAAAGVTNVFSGGEVDLIINHRLRGTYDDYWYLGAGPFMALVLQRDVEPCFLDAMDSETRFIMDELMYSLEGDASPAAYAWQNVYGGIL